MKRLRTGKPLLSFLACALASAAVAIVTTTNPTALAWEEEGFADKSFSAFSAQSDIDTVIGHSTTYQIKKGDTLLDIARWYGLSPKEISDANQHMDLWSPPVGRQIRLPMQHILPDGPLVGLVLNIPEMRLYYFSRPAKSVDGGDEPSALLDARVEVYTFPVGIGRVDWRTPVGRFRVTAKTKDPTWVVPKDIYREHLERDGEAARVVQGGDPENPLGRYRLSLSLSMYSIHGTDVPWGVGMMVSHGCIRLYPEDIDHLFHMVKVGTTGRFVYQPIKFGVRAGQVYAEIHDDLYGKFTSLWELAMKEVQRRGLYKLVDLPKLAQAVELKTGQPVNVTLADVGAVSMLKNPRQCTICR